jgi:hypothetical protein
MKHHVVFCYNDHGAVIVSTTVETEAYDPLPGSEAWLEMVKEKCADVVNYDVVVISWQALLETGTVAPSADRVTPEDGDAALARGLAARNERIAAIEAAKKCCGDCDHRPKWATDSSPEFCKAMGILVGDNTRVTCHKFVTKGTLAPEQRCGDCLYLHPGGCNLLDRHVNANTIGRCGRFAAKGVTP